MQRAPGMAVSAFERAIAKLTPSLSVNCGHVYGWVGKAAGPRAGAW